MNAQEVDERGNTGTHPAKPLKRRVKVALLAIAAIAILVPLGVAAGWFAHKPALVVPGEVEAAETKVAPKVVGRAQALHVSEGDKVRKAQLLVSLENQGLPVVRIVDPQNVWGRFNLPEDLLSKIRMGTTFRIRVPALGNEEVPVKVNYSEGFPDLGTPLPRSHSVTESVQSPKQPAWLVA